VRLGSQVNCVSDSVGLQVPGGSAREGLQTPGGSAREGLQASRVLAWEGLRTPEVSAREGLQALAVCLTSFDCRKSLTASTPSFLLTVRRSITLFSRIWKLLSVARLTKSCSVKKKVLVPSCLEYSLSLILEPAPNLIMVIS